LESSEALQVLSAEPRVYAVPTLAIPEDSVNSDSVYRFYAAEISYFSAKVRPALRYKGLRFVELLPTPEAYRDVILKRTGLGFVPVVVTPEDETLQDTSDILDALELRHPEPPLEPRTPVQQVAARLIELYADEFLLLPAMHYRWGTPEGETKARGDFAAFSGDPERANQFADRMSGSLAFLGVCPESAAVIEAHTYALLDALSEHFANHSYALGGAPSLADCALMGPLYAHLYLDAVPGRLLRERAQPVCHWIERMNHPDPDARGEWLADDALAPTLMPLLRLVGQDATPLFFDTVRTFEAWADERPADVEEPPRAVGMHESGFRGVRFTRYTSAYTLWMLQRTLDVVRTLAPDERRAVDAALAGTGCEALLDYEPRHRLGKRNFKLVFEG
jgi:glutathione S-transferase